MSEESKETPTETSTEPSETTEEKNTGVNLREQVVDAIKTIYDPEIPINIYELGLIYTVNLDADKNVDVKMTLTSPACPVAGILPGQVEAAVRAVDGVNSAQVEVVWDPPWDMSMMSEAARLELGFM